MYALSIGGYILDIQEKLSHLKPLNPNQVQDIKDKASKMVLSVLGEPPDRAKYEQHIGEPPQPPRPPQKDHWWQVFYGWGQDMNLFDRIGLVMLVVVSMITVTHFVEFGFDVASATYEEPTMGIIFPIATVVIMTQTAMFFLTELGAIFFLMFHRISVYRADRANKNLSLWAKFSVPLSWVCAGISLVVNVLAFLKYDTTNIFQVGVLVVIGVMVVAVVLTLGHSFADKIVDRMIERDEQREFYEKQLIEYGEFRQQMLQQYANDMDEWQRFSRNPEDHPEYRRKVLAFIKEWYVGHINRSRKLPFSIDDCSEKVFRFVAAREYANQFQTRDEEMQQMIDFFTERTQIGMTTNGQTQ